MSPTYPRVGLKPRAERNQVPTMLRLALSPQMVMLLDIHGFRWCFRWARGRLYISRDEAQQIYDAIPPEGRTGLALRRRVKALIRRWDSQCR